MTSVACIGECMIELKQAGHGLFSRGYGGDTLNTAVYLARLGVGTDYITALGDDSLSDEMIAGWTAEGVGTARVSRLQGKLPGLYMIQTDEKGERRFFHWRESAAARSLMDLPETSDILDSLASYETVYLSAITLSLFDEGGLNEIDWRAYAGERAGKPYCVRYQLPCPGLARSRSSAHLLSESVRCVGYCAGFDGRFAAALSLQK